MARLANAKRGDIVKMWFQSNSPGMGKGENFTILYGRAERVGPKACVIRWESGVTNHIRYAEPKGVELFLRGEDPEQYDDAVKLLNRRIGPLP